MRIRSQRLILLTPFATPPNPGGIIIPDPISTTKRVRTSRDIIWDMEDDSEVTGTVEINRSILWDIQEESGPELVNYIEIPFFQQQWGRDSDVGVSVYNNFRGVLRIWESGTVQMIGVIKTTKQSDNDYTVGTGLLGFSPTLHVIGTAPAGVGGAWGADVAVSWSYKMGVGEFFVPLTYITGAINTEPLLEYPTGWILPHKQFAIPDPSYVWEANISRSGDNLISQGTIGGGGVFGVNCGLVSYTLDTSTWTLGSLVIHFNGSPPATYGPISKAIPDSPTVGALFDHSLGAGLGGSTRNTDAFIGPIFREAYSTPTIQQGIDPIP